MSMVTRCPHCATSFRITSHLLKMHQGLVRCGHCSEVFNAFDSLSTVHGAPPEEKVSREAPRREAPRVEHPPEAIEPQPAFELPAEPEAERKTVRDVEEPPGSQMVLAEKPEISEPEIAEEFFVGKKPSKFGWAWTMGSVLLLALLCAQAAYYYRMELSIGTPGLKPALRTYCRLLGCTLPLPKKADLIGIESSSLQAETGRVGVIDLNASIRNSASFAQDYPLLELTLTDAQDAPLARKIFKPSDYLRKEIRVDEGIAPNGAANARLALDTGALLPNGYRLYLFYP